MNKSISIQKQSHHFNTFKKLSIYPAIITLALPFFGLTLSTLDSRLINNNIAHAADSTEVDNCIKIFRDDKETLRCEVYELMYQNKQQCDIVITFNHELQRRTKAKKCRNEATPMRRLVGYTEYPIKS